jgi:A/G-specific adenine glycosylase
VVDGNVYRVLSRYLGVETPINTTEGKKTFTALAQSLLPPKEASAYNQAIMDFGAIQCTPQSPQCGACPLQESCVAFREDRVGTLPVKLKTLKVKERRLSYVYIRCKGQVAIHRRGAGDIWQGLYEPYLVAEDNNGIDLQQCLLLKKDVRHVLTHRILLADFYLLETAVRPELAEDYIWVQEQDLEKYGVPRLVELLYEEVRAVLGNRK